MKRVTVSMLSAYLYCKRKLFLERVLGLFEPEKASLVKGTIRHETYDMINKIEEQIIKSIIPQDNLESVYTTYLQTYSHLLRESIIDNKYRLRKIKLSLIDAYQQILPFFKKESELRALNAINYIEKYGVFGNDLWERLTPKIESEFKIDSDNLELRGIVDQIEIYPEEKVPIELKTGSTPNEGVWPGHKIQLAAYALLMEERFGESVKEGIVYYLDSQEKRQVVINPFLKEEVKEIKEKVRNLLKSKVTPDRTENINKCRKCGLRKQCFDDGFIQNQLS